MDFDLPMAVVVILMTVEVEKYLTGHCVDNYQIIIRDENNIGYVLKALVMVVTALILKIALIVAFISCFAITVFRLVW